MVCASATITRIPGFASCGGWLDDLGGSLPISVGLMAGMACRRRRHFSPELRTLEAVFVDDSGNDVLARFGLAPYHAAHTQHAHIVRRPESSGRHTDLEFDRRANGQFRIQVEQY